MPIYEYRCTACDTVFERLVSSVKAATMTGNCPSCKNEKVEKIISASSIRSGTGITNTHKPSPGCGNGGFS